MKVSNLIPMFASSLILVFSLQASATTYKWLYNYTTGMNCEETTVLGEYLRSASPDACRNELGIHAKWGYDANDKRICTEMTPKGEYIRTVDDSNFCISYVNP